MNNSFGKSFVVTTFGESHGTAVGCVVDGCPAGMPFSLEAVQSFLMRRRPGQSEFTTARAENDRVELLSGVESNITLGSPIALVVHNTDAQKKDYGELSQVYRPSHADYTTQIKYGIRAQSGGGRASARETIGRVAAAGVAMQLVQHIYPSLDVLSFVTRIEKISSRWNHTTLNREDIEKSPVRCPDTEASEKMCELLRELRAAGDTAGGIIQTVVRNPPAGLGEPVFDKLEADLAKAMLSLPASKGFEIGSGFAGSSMRGSEHNDSFIRNDSGSIQTTTNNSGGVQGGISNGMPIEFSVAFKPVSTLFKEQNTVDEHGNAVILKPTRGRHDPCVLPRAVAIVEAMTWLVLADHALRFRTSQLQGAPYAARG